MKPELTYYSDFDEENVTWLWKDWLALGTASILAGAGGVGKGNIVAGLVATITGDKPWPDGTACEHPGNVLIISKEDDPTFIIKPRAIAAGADGDRIAGFKLIGFGKDDEAVNLDFQISHQLAVLRETIKAGQFRLAIFDPITSYLGKLKVNDNGLVRQALDPMSDLVKELETTFLYISHENKEPEGGKSNRRRVEKMSGANQWSAVPRTALSAYRDGDGRYLEVTKTNIGGEGEGKRIPYEIKPVSYTSKAGTLIETSMAVFSQDTPAEAPQPKPMGPGQRAQALLLDLLADGPMLEASIRGRADAAGIKAATLTKAKKDLKIPSRFCAAPSGEKRWFWCLPEHMDRDCPPKPYDASIVVDGTWADLVSGVMH